MKQAWFSTQELLSVVGLPGTVRGCVILPGMKNGTGAADKGRREMRDDEGDAKWSLEAPMAGVSSSLAT